MNEDITILIVSIVYTLFGVLFFKVLYDWAKTNSEKYGTLISDDPVWIFACYPGGLTVFGPIGIIYSVIQLLST